MRPHQAPPRRAQRAVSTFLPHSLAAKQRLLDSSRALAQMAASPKAEALTAEWQKVEAVYAELAARK